jgi:hypothetical protein
MNPQNHSAVTRYRLPAAWAHCSRESHSRCDWKDEEEER